MSARNHQEAETMVRGTGSRITRPRVEVLAVLLGADRALSHAEVEHRVNAALGIDRVTVYRVLGWLNEQGLAHKIAGEDRVSRYNAATHSRSPSHAHFQCKGCGTVICLDTLHESLRVRLPQGFVSEDVALMVKGFCAGCSHNRRAPRSRSGIRGRPGRRAASSSRRGR
jgi:Fur family transcriptional regulator, ferric uptake regulator